MALLASANYLLEAEIGPLPESFPGDWSWTSNGSIQPQLLLYGAAVENLLKAIRVAQGVPALTGRSLNGDLATHDLRRYAEEAGLKPDKTEARLLQQLQDVLEAGKYPVAKKPGRNALAWSFDYPGDISAIWALLERVDAMLRASGTRCMPSTDLRTLTRRQE
jgi:aryl-alcohol dehydrogenase-like predicted oxidoreductase